MTAKSFEDPNQGKLLDAVVSSHDGINSTQINVIENPSLPNPDATPQPEVRTAGVVDRRERARLLLTALDNLAKANMYRGYTQIEPMPLGHTKLEARYGANLPTVTEEATYKAKNRSERAKEAFTKAYTLGTVDLDGGTPDVTDAYKSFRQAYGGTNERAKRRNAFRKLLEQEVQVVGPQAKGDTYTLPAPKELPELDTREKLQALQEDKYANYLPATNTEKNQAVELLDYIEKPGGIYRRLLEISQKRQKDVRKAYKESEIAAVELEQQGISSLFEKMNYGQLKKQAQEEGKRAVVSVLYEYGDHMHSAAHSLSKLEQFREVLVDTDNLALSLKDVLGDNEHVKGLSARELIRHIDGVALRDKGETQGIDPLRTRENRQLNPGNKNKTVEDRYTTGSPDQTFEEYVEQRLATVRVVTARKAIGEAIIDQTNRHTFWHNVLTHVQYGYRKYAEEVLSVAS